MGIFGNMMNNYFYGKSGKGDYTVADMPQNRRQLFGTVLRTRWSAMIGVNLLYMVAWIPAVIWSIFNVQLLYNIDVLKENGGIASYFMMYLLILAPCIWITGPWTAGATYVMRNWARDEHSFVLSDFWDAVKGNWKQGLITSFVSGCLPVCMFVAWQFYGSMLEKSYVFIVPLAVVLLIGLVCKLAEMVIYTLMVTYQLRMRDLIRNAVLMALAKLPLTILMKLLTWIVPIICIVLMLVAPGIESYIFMAIALLYALFVPAFNRLLIASYSNSLCEKYMNSKIEGARTDIGLRPENWDDTEYIPEDDED